MPQPEGAAHKIQRDWAVPPPERQEGTVGPALTSVAMTHSFLSSDIKHTDWYMDSLGEHIADIRHSGFSLREYKTGAEPEQAGERLGEGASLDLAQRQGRALTGREGAGEGGGGWEGRGVGES